MDELDLFRPGPPLADDRFMDARRRADGVDVGDDLLDRGVTVLSRTDERGVTFCDDQCIGTLATAGSTVGTFSTSCPPLDL